MRFHEKNWVGFLGVSFKGGKNTPRSPSPPPRLGLKEFDQ